LFHVLDPLACSNSELTFETMNLFILIGLLGWGISPSQGLYLHGKAQQRKMQMYIHVSKIQTHNPSVQAVQYCALETA